MTFHRIIWVSPLDGGWAVHCADVEPLVFRSGRRAEEQARALAACLASTGKGAQVRIQDRAMNLVGATVYPAA